VPKVFHIILLFFLFGNQFAFSQKIEDVIKKSDTLDIKEIDPLRPTKASFYSALLPGLGQAYNKKYWKIPIVYGAIGTSLYFYINNNKKYHNYRDAYKRRLQGFNDDEYQYRYNHDVGVSQMDFYLRGMDVFILLFQSTSDTRHD
jgi:hypothetical protein